MSAVTSEMTKCFVCELSSRRVRATMINESIRPTLEITPVIPMTTANAVNTAWRHSAKYCWSLTSALASSVQLKNSVQLGWNSMLDLSTWRSSSRKVWEKWKAKMPFTTRWYSYRWWRSIGEIRELDFNVLNDAIAYCTSSTELFNCTSTYCLRLTRTVYAVTWSAI